MGCAGSTPLVPKVANPATADTTLVADCVAKTSTTVSVPAYLGQERGDAHVGTRPAEPVKVPVTLGDGTLFEVVARESVCQVMWSRALGDDISKRGNEVLVEANRELCAKAGENVKKPSLIRDPTGKVVGALQSAGTALQVGDHKNYPKWPKAVCTAYSTRP